MSHEELAGGILNINLSALAENYRILSAEAPSSECGGVVKADGYGLGVGIVGQTLYDAGCRTFFVALPAEGAKLRQVLPNVPIIILNGFFGDGSLYLKHNLIPALGSLDDITRWAEFCRNRAHKKLPAYLHVDTGISRLGIPNNDLPRLSNLQDEIDAIDFKAIMTHLACADEPGHTMNDIQRQNFQNVFRELPDSLKSLPRSFANSSGVFLGADYQLDIMRPGVALYGANPTSDKPNPMQDVVELKGKIMQVDTLDKGTTVGYGSAYITSRTERIAKIAIGYADGYPRNLGGIAEAAIGGKRVPVVGRISMDMLTVDITDINENISRVGDFVYLIGGGITLDEVAAKAGTIPYEILTSLGHRYHRNYLGGA